MSSEPKSRFAVYKEALRAVSARTGTPLPALVLSFGILHELTAIVPLVGVFYGARTLGVGERLVSSIIQSADETSDTEKELVVLHWAKQKSKSWIEEGDRWAIKVGRRYGIFGYEKRPPGTVDNMEEMTHKPGHIAGDVANVVFAYGVTKALLPLRIGASVYFAPMFSRGVILPIQRTIVQVFRRRS